MIAQHCSPLGTFNSLDPGTRHDADEARDLLSSVLRVDPVKFDEPVVRMQTFLHVDILRILIGDGRVERRLQVTDV